jgi:tRNA-specific adenosine deaminase 3
MDDNGRMVAVVEHAKRPKISHARMDDEQPSSSSHQSAIDNTNSIILIPSKPRNRLELIDMIAVEIDAPDCRTLVPLLSKLLPLPKTMCHVKRVRKTHGGKRAMILIERIHLKTIPDDDDQTNASPRADVREMARQQVKDIVSKYDTHTLHLARVPKYGPHTREYQERWTKEYWPVVIMMPDKMTMRERHEIDAAEGRIMRQHMNTVRALASQQRGIQNACIIVNPVTNTIVGSGVDGSEEHPLKHPIFNAVQEVADWQQSTWYHTDDTTSSPQKQSTLKKVLNQPCALDTGDRAGHADLPPYLCTGYDCYVLHEPCTMCAMALVHSRLRRIIYSIEDANGVLSSGSHQHHVRLHALKSLNHHFLVYRIRDGAS